MNLRNIVGISFFVIVGIFFILTALMVHDFGDPNSRYDIETKEIVETQTDMDDHIIENSQEETGANNAVTAVVFDYRGFDTLGEATVLFTAVAGVVLVFRRFHK